MTGGNRLRRLTVLAACLLLGMLCALPTAAQPPDTGLPPFVVNPDLPSEIVFNAGQGLGQCHWVDTAILASPIVGWAYDAGREKSGWRTVEPQDGEFDWASMDTQVAKARALGKRIWLELLTTEGSAPEWALQAGVPLVGSRGGTPLPWNATYQQLLRRAVHAMAEQFDGNPTVDAIIVMAGGCYGEMSICAPQADRRAWEAAGYSDQRFIEATKQILDIYLEEEHVWEDGTRSRGFVKTPVVLQLGAGLYGHTLDVIAPVAEYAISQYGMRVWLKYNGWGGNHDLGWLYQECAGHTRVGYEPAGNSDDFLAHPTSYVQAALDQHASFLCLQQPYYRADTAAWQEARELAARYLGAQIVHHGTEVPPELVPGEEHVFIQQWENRGATPLTFPMRQGTRDVPATYEIVIGLWETGGGSSVLEQSFVPTVPTTEWHAARLITTQSAVRVPSDVPEGRYEVRVGLRIPNTTAEDERSYFRLIHEGPEDALGRHIVGETTIVRRAKTATVQSATSPTAVPTAESSEGTNWFTSLLGRLVAWLRELLSGLRYFSRVQPVARTG
jgi:hypothetical protein